MNNMKFQVMSRQRAKKYSYEVKHKCAFISITDVFSEENRFDNNSNIVGVFKVQFDDVERGENNCITEKQGKDILKFVMNIKDKVDEVIVHCEAGVSRSAGVCAALMKIINGNDFEIFDNPRFCPNMTCYRTILNAFFDSVDEQEINEKEQHNLKIWRIAQEIE